MKRVLVVDNHFPAKGSRPSWRKRSVSGAVGSAGEARNILHEHVPDSIIVDTRLPDEKGPAFAHRIREVALETPTLVLR